MIADWYFDFVSPFAYLQSEQLALLPPRIGIRYRPVLFAGLLSANGQKGPAEIPAKRFGTPAELGQTCAFLCSIHAAYLTGLAGNARRSARSFAGLVAPASGRCFVCFCLCGSTRRA